MTDAKGGPGYIIASMVAGAAGALLVATGMAGIEYAYLFAVLALVPVVISRLRAGGRGKIGGFKSPLLQKHVELYNTSEKANISSIIESMKRGTVYLDHDHYERLIAILFAANIRHLALDSSLPSEYCTRYPGALERQSSTLTRRVLENNCRILMQDTDSLIMDTKNPAYSDFFDWHYENGVELRHLSGEECVRIIRANGLDPDDSSSGFSIFADEYAIMFSRRDSGLLKVMIFERGHDMFDAAKSAWNQIQKKSSKVGRFGSYFKLNAGTIENYLEYVNPEERWKKIEPLITAFIGKYRDEGRVVLDAASGMGFEFHKLLTTGYAVDANEVMPALRESGRKFYKERKYGTDYLPTAHTWEKMSEIGWESKYGAVLVIGNSIRMQEVIGQKKSIASFYKILQDGGTLIIDERNFAIFEDKQELIHRCSLNPDDPSLFRETFNIQNTHNTMFNGTDFVSVPFDTGHGSVHLCYYKQSPEIDTLSKAKDNMIIHSEMHFGKPMEELLREAGFSTVRKFADYGMERELSGGQVPGDVSVLVYVATKGRSHA